MRTEKILARGFTIVEMIVIIAVIGVLAAVTLVAYYGFQQDAKQTALLADLDNATSALELDLKDDGRYPATVDLTLELTDKGSGLSTNSGTKYQYTVNTSTTSPSYCLTGTNGTASFYIDSTSTTSTKGGCPGDGVGGVAAIKNIVTNPRGIGSSAGWFVPLSTAYVTETSNVTWGGRSDWHRFVWNGTNYSTTRLLVNLSDLVNGATYTFSVLLGNSGTAAISGSLDFNDSPPGLSFTVQPGATKRVYSSASRATYDNTYRFLDINPGAGSAGVLVTDVLITQGTTQYDYADGSSANWKWTGTPNASTSTGPAL